MIGCGGDGKGHKRKKKNPEATGTELEGGQKSDDVSQNEITSKSSTLRNYEESNGFVTKSYVLLTALPKDKDCRIANTLFSNDKNGKLQPVATALPAAATFQSGTIGEEELDELAGIIETDDGDSRTMLESYRGSLYIFIDNAPALLAKDPVTFVLDLRCEGRKHVRVPFTDFSKSEDLVL
jgi:hypothetical protein